MQFCDKTAYVWGLRYRWDPSLLMNPVRRFAHFMPPCCIKHQILKEFPLALSSKSHYWRQPGTIRQQWEISLWCRPKLSNKYKQGTGRTLRINALVEPSPGMVAFAHFMLWLLLNTKDKYWKQEQVETWLLALLVGTSWSSFFGVEWPSGGVLASNSDFWSILRILIPDQCNVYLFLICLSNQWKQTTRSC